MKILINVIVILLISLNLVPVVLADTPADASHTFTIGQPKGYGVAVNPGDSAESLIGMITKNAITLIFSFAAIAVIFYFLWGAFDWIISGGDKEKLNSARRKMTHALIGLALLALSFVIIAIVGEIVGFKPLGELQIRGLGNPDSNIPTP